MAKAAEVVFADTGSPEGLGRVVNALTTAHEFKDAGDGIVVVFDGAGTKWVAELRGARVTCTTRRWTRRSRPAAGACCRSARASASR